MRIALFGDEIHIYQNEHRPTGPNGHLDHKIAYPQSLQGYGTLHYLENNFSKQTEENKFGKKYYINYIQVYQLVIGR